MCGWATGCGTKEFKQTGTNLGSNIEQLYNAQLPFY